MRDPFERARRGRDRGLGPGVARTEEARRMAITEQVRPGVSIADVDPELWAAMEGERHRQHDKIELIASENYTSAAVMEAQGSWLTNKYAEGLPGKRYYGGCEGVVGRPRLRPVGGLRPFPRA